MDRDDLAKELEAAWRNWIDGAEGRVIADGNRADFADKVHVLMPTILAALRTPWGDSVDLIPVRGKVQTPVQEAYWLLFDHISKTMGKDNAMGRKLDAALSTLSPALSASRPMGEGWREALEAIRDNSPDKLASDVASAALDGRYLIGCKIASEPPRSHAEDSSDAR